MSRLLHCEQRPDSVQVEIYNCQKEEILSFMSEHHYVLVHTHFTRYGLERIQRGADPRDHVYNAVFKPRQKEKDSAPQRAIT